mmetsp:Transcript_9185/g.19883  ORF Transcript_9185/g.19883 Transcript_9185/m.19883 type:complete len:306 (+) Transcript_9185:233-1150(+)
MGLATSSFLRNPGTPNLLPSTLAILILSSLHALVVLGLPNPPNALEWKLISALSYWTFLNTDVAASHPHFSASFLARTPILSPNLRSTSFAAQAVYPSMSPGWTRKPVSSSRMRSGIPPAAQPTTGTPEAMLSRTTKPRVSESLGIMKASALANALLNSSPLNCPVNTVLVPSKCSLSSSCCGPFPTMQSLAFGPSLSSTGLMSLSLFSAPHHQKIVGVAVGHPLPHRLAFELGIESHGVDALPPHVHPRHAVLFELLLHLRAGHQGEVPLALHPADDRTRQLLDGRDEPHVVSAVGGEKTTTLP